MPLSICFRTVLFTPILCLSLLLPRSVHALEPGTVYATVQVIDTLLRDPAPDPSLSILKANRELLIAMHDRLDGIEEGIAKTLLEFELLPKTLLDSHLKAQSLALGNRITAIGENTLDAYVSHREDTRSFANDPQRLVLLEKDLRATLFTNINDINTLSRDLLKRSEAHGVHALTVIAAAYSELFLRIRFARDFQGSPSIVKSQARRYLDELAKMTDWQNENSLSGLIRKTDQKIMDQLEKSGGRGLSDCIETANGRRCEIFSTSPLVTTDLVAGQNDPVFDGLPDCADIEIDRFEYDGGITHPLQLQHQCLHDIKLTISLGGQINALGGIWCELGVEETYHEIILGLYRIPDDRNDERRGLCVSTVKRPSSGMPNCKVSFVKSDTTGSTFCIPRDMGELKRVTSLYDNRQFGTLQAALSDARMQVSHLQELLDLRDSLSDIERSARALIFALENVEKGNFDAISFADVVHAGDIDIERAVTDYVLLEIEEESEAYDAFVEHVAKRRESVARLVASQNEEIRTAFEDAAQASANNTFLEHLHLGAALYSWMYAIDREFRPDLGDFNLDDIVDELDTFAQNDTGRSPAEDAGMKRISQMIKVARFWSGFRNAAKQMEKMRHAEEAVRKTVPVNQVREFDAFAIGTEFCCFVPKGQGILSPNQRYLGTYRIGGGLDFDLTSVQPPQE
ncbi:hypothetical protein EI983_08555 [Roseovarius faecimaris]|uniref:Secreted protein n=1 Tax=Roseovarius faecimaris TaxID=2494550 RepID=A0A6I6IMJ6_9RHOB|nr:hypothetical protein [Roseovarius faecimaris]QGX98330.1 hypothetical protein EI983_08555 [Roseovarius faecimaris]